MLPPEYDVLGIGNAIVDVLSRCTEDVLIQLNLRKGGMTLIDEAAADALYGRMGPATECSGGSAANTLAGIASLGARCAYIGKVKNDQLGAIFRHDMRSIGVAFDTPASAHGPATARCLIFITPDAQRTMNTFLGACGTVSEADIDERLVAAAGITYIEGYLWDQPAAKAAIRKAFSAAREAGRRIAFTLSDAFCVHRHRADFLKLLEGSIDILFANEQELLALFETHDLMDALSQLQGRCELAAVTRSEKGCVMVSRDGIDTIPTQAVPQVVDTTGAGDLFASGFLFGLARGWDARACAQLGNRCAGQIIQHMGARSPQPLVSLLAA